MDARSLIETLNLAPHPEGGWFVETWRHDAGPGARAAGTAIYFLLERGQRSRWHRVDSTEIWHHYAGSPLRLSIAADDRVSHLELGADLSAGQRPQAIVPPRAWQAAESLGDWTLVGCTVSPGFEFAGFEMAPEGWEPG